MSSPTNRLNIKKRKKVYSNEFKLLRQQLQEFLALELTNTPLDQKPTQPLEDDKLINYINKMHPRVNVSQQDKFTYITILLTLSEPPKILDQKQKLIDNFKIGDILVTDPVPGSIDQYLTIYGKPIYITKCLMYVIYYLNVIMHINYDLFTFKTANYKFTILLNSQNLKLKHNLKYLDIAQYSEHIYSGFIQGDLHSIFNFVLQTIEQGNNVDNRDIKNSPIFGLHIDSALCHRTLKTKELINKANNRLLEYLYSSTGKLM